MSYYYYSISTDFSGNIDLSQLDYEVGSSDITADFEGIDLTGDQLKIKFTQTLSPGDHTLLNNLVDNHTPSEIEFGKFNIELLPPYKVIDTSTYRINGHVFFQGTKYMEPTHICSVSHLTSGTAYFIRVWDETNDRLIVESSLNNNLEQICDLGDITNLTRDTAKWEIHTKAIGEAQIKNVTIFYN